MSSVSTLGLTAALSVALHGAVAATVWVLSAEPPRPETEVAVIAVTLVEEPAAAPAADPMPADGPAGEVTAPPAPDAVPAAPPPDAAPAPPPPRKPQRAQPSQVAVAPAAAKAAALPELAAPSGAAPDAQPQGGHESAGAARSEAGEAVQAAVAVPGWRLGSAGNPPPRYPDLARRRGWEGMVELAVSVAADGHAAEVAVVRSSGRDILDRAAAETVGKWRFEPARAAGRPVLGQVVVPIRFRLTEE